LPSACISSGSDASVGDWQRLPCAARVSEQQAPDAVVLVATLKPEGPFADLLPCSGVLIAPRLVVTSRQCAADQSATAEVGCDRNNGWQPISDAVRSSYLGPSLDVRGNIAILAGDGALRTIGLVEEVVSTPARSFCVDDFALLILRDPVEGREVLPVRFEATTRLGEEVRLSGFGGTSAPMARRQLPATVLQIVSDRGDVRAPPRSLYLRGQACSFDRGGAVFSPDTGALIGTIVDDPASGCGDREGTTLAVDLSRHADFLLDTAQAHGIELRSELDPALPDGQRPPACEPAEP
jgi:hypothetical protein